MRVVIVDDETKARENLTMLLESIDSSIEVVGEASNINIAKTVIESSNPDVVFLDIEMPGGNGFQLFDIMDYSLFQVVFVTAYEEFAIKAFQVSAIDYLLKPIDMLRLEDCLSRLSKVVNQKQQLISLKETLESKSLNQITVPKSSGYVIVDVSSILFFKAEEAYTKICVQQQNKIKEYLYAKHLNHFETLFEGSDTFYRTHRSWMVNLKAIQSFDKSKGIVNVNTFKIPVSRRRLKDFSTCLNSLLPFLKLK